MYTIIIITFLWVSIEIYRMTKEGYLDIVEIILFSFLNALLSAFIGFCFACVLPSYYVVEKSIFDLESIQDGSKMQGQFFLGSGYINEQMHYSFYLNEEKGYKLYSISSNDAHIRYTNNKPKLEMLEEKKSNAFINNFSLCELKTNYIIYVPKGSILQNYDLDAK